MVSEAETRIALQVRARSKEIARGAARGLRGLAWYADLDADVRASLNLVLDQAVLAFSDWLASGRDPAVAAAALEGAHTRITTHLSLERSVELVRFAANVVEGLVSDFIEAGDRDRVLRDATLFNRDLAFAVAISYARVAESQGSIDARHQARLIETLLRDESIEAVSAAAGILGWQIDSPCVVIGGRHRQDDAVSAVAALARKSGLKVVSSIQGENLVMIGQCGAEGASELLRLATAVIGGAIVRSPAVADLPSAKTEVSTVLATLRAVPLCDDCPRVVLPEDLIVERVLLGEPAARAQLIEAVYRPLGVAGEHLVSTASAFLATFGHLQETAQVLHVHPNTVRYRLKRVQELTGRDLRHARDAVVVYIAIVLGRDRRGGADAP